MQSTLLLLSAIALAGPLDAAPASAAQAVVERALVTPIMDVPVPAQEPGMLVDVKVREGMQVRDGELLAQIEDSQAQSQKQIAMFEQEASREEAQNESDILYAQKAREVAYEDWKRYSDSNQKVAGAVTRSDLERAKLEWERAGLQIKVAEMKKVIARLTMQAKGAEVEAAENNIKRRQIVAPWDGVIERVVKQQGEWVQPGDPVLRMLRMDRLRVEGFAYGTKHSPVELRGKPVVVEAELERGRRVQFNGRVTFVSNIVQNNQGQYQVWAEVENRQENGEWLLRPGLVATMTIDTAAQAAPAATAQRAPPVER